MEWQPIETAPKDGTRIMLWRGYPRFGFWQEMVIAQWFNDSWRWPDPRENASTHDVWSEDDLYYGFEDEENFTHWMPLPPPPAL